ncbi:hypothetical protein ACU6TU_08395 [Halomonas sp. LS-001]
MSNFLFMSAGNGVGGESAELPPVTVPTVRLAKHNQRFAIVESETPYVQVITTEGSAVFPVGDNETLLMPNPDKTAPIFNEPGCIWVGVSEDGRWGAPVDKVIVKIFALRFFSIYDGGFSISGDAPTDHTVRITNIEQGWSETVGVELLGWRDDARWELPNNNQVFVEGDRVLFELLDSSEASVDSFQSIV